MKYRYSFKTDEGTTEWTETVYPGDLYIEMHGVFGSEDFAMEVLAWAEEAKPGERYEDDDVIIECV